MNLRTSALAVAMSLAVAGPALAGPVDDAKSHFDAVASGNVDKIVAQYGSDARLDWVGGPLNGTYTGTDKIKDVWTKFAKANAPLQVKVGHVEESTNPAGSTVTANVEFKGKATVKVRYVLTYRAGKLSSEVWQIDPKLAGY